MAQFNLRVRQVILDELLLHPAEASRLSYFASSGTTKKAQAMESTYLGSQGDGMLSRRTKFQRVANDFQISGDLCCLESFVQPIAW